jgi:cytochrome c biogenesis protein CcdA/glutaredoxin
MPHFDGAELLGPGVMAMHRLNNCAKCLIATFVIAFAFCYSAIPLFGQTGKQVDIIFFYGSGCPHCAKMREFLQATQEKQPQLKVREYEVYSSSENARLLERMADAYRTQVKGVPTTFLGGNVIFGFADEMRPQIEQQISQCIEQHCPSPLDRLSQSARTQPLTLPAVLLGAAVDAINPCEFAVLIILITSVLSASGRKRALWAGLAFSASIFVSYYMMGIGLYSAVEAAGITRGIYIAVSALAIVTGLFNLKDYFWYGKWFVMEVPLSWRPKLRQIIQGVTSVPGAFLIGFVVSLFLLPCTSGPYIVILGLLAETETRTSAMLWLLLYNIVFIAPMVGITLALYFGLTTVEKAEEWRTKNLETLHLVAGAIILLLGIGMLASLWLGYV